MYLRLGGLDQWVTIRGDARVNPPLVVLHGGPGFSDASFFQRFNNEELEKSFTVVHWDQRGTGKSFDRKIPKASMTVEQFVSDLGELVDVVRERTGFDRVALLGHSWGSALGVIYAARFPQKVAAYVGSGQIGDWAAAEAASWKYAVAEAERRADRKALAKLRAIGPPPYSAKSLFAERMCLARFERRIDPRALWEVVKGWRGFRFSLDAMWPEVSQMNLIELAPELAMPVFLLLGRYDHWVPPETSVAFLDALVAPSKTLVWFEKSGHEPFVDEPEKFNLAMVQLVRPVLGVKAASSDNRAAPPTPHA